MTFAELIVKFGTQGAEKIKSDVKQIGSGFEEATSKAKKFSDVVSQIATGNLLSAAVTGIAGGILDLSKSLFQAGMNAESMDARFSAFGLNAEKTRDFLFKVSSASTMTSNQLNEMSLALQQSGFNIYSVVPRLAKWSDAIGGGTEKLQGMVRFLNLLRAGVKPDQELLQSLGFSDILIKAGLKFEEGKLVGDIRSAMERVMAEIDRMTGPIATKMGQTFEARFANLTDFLDKIKETIGRELLTFFGPIVDALNKVLGAVINSGVLKKTIQGFFAFGNQITKNLAAGMDNKNAEQMVAKIMANILGTIQALPTQMYLFGQIAIKVFDHIISKANELIYSINVIAAKAQDPFGIYGMVDKLGPAPKPVGKLDIAKEQRQLALTNSIRAEIIDENTKSILSAMNKKVSAISPEGKALLKDTIVGSGRDSASKDKDEKHKKETHKKADKHQKTLEQIRDHTKSAELTLREFTYGGGVLGGGAVSKADLAMRGKIYAPSTTGLSDLERGVLKITRSYTNNNNLNLNFGRS